MQFMQLSMFLKLVYFLVAWLCVFCMVVCLLCVLGVFFMRLPIVESCFFVFGLNVHFLHIIVYTYVHTYIHSTENLLLECMIILLEMSLQAYQEWRGSVTNNRCMALDAAAFLGIYIHGCWCSPFFW